MLVDIGCRWTQPNLNVIWCKKDTVSNYAACFASCSGVNQVDDLPPASNKDAVSASSPRCDRAPDHKIYKRMYSIEINCNAKFLVNHQNSDSSYNEDSITAIEY